MRDRLRRDLTAALAARDRVRIAALRSAIAAIGNAEAQTFGADEGDQAPVVTSEHIAGSQVGLGTADVPRRELSAADLDKILEREVGDRLAAARDYREYGRPEDADRLEAEARVLGGYLG